MSKKPSAETELRHARSDLIKIRKDYFALKATCEHYRIRATKAEQEISEWKARFDALLHRSDDHMPVKVCNCAAVKGQVTAWTCPVHGHQP